MRLVQKQTPKLRLDLRGALPGADFAALRVGYGNALLPLAEFFETRDDGDATTLHLEGELARCDGIGWQLAAGRIVAHGSVGDHAGALMSGGEVVVEGSAALHAACEMSGGRLDVHGDVGDDAAGALPGSMDGMRGGCFVVRGNAGARFADRMRRGTALIHGDAGDFLASRLVAGSVALGGRAGAHPGYGMRRGSLVFAGPAPAIADTFVPAGAEAPVFWQLLARDLAAHGGAFAELPQRAITRWLGDLAADGRGELILPL